MAVNPLEGLMSVAANHQLLSGSAVEPQSQQSRASSPTSLHQPRPRTRCAREPKKWQGQLDRETQTLRSHHSPENAARERSRVRNLRQAFHSLQAALPSVPPDTKLSKLDVLVLATNYIAYLTETLDQEGALAEHTLPSRPGGYLHPVKKWPMRSLMYCGSMGDLLSGVPGSQTLQHAQDGTQHLTPAFEAEKE